MAHNTIIKSLMTILRVCFWIILLCDFLCECKGDTDFQNSEDNVEHREPKLKQEKQYNEDEAFCTSGQKEKCVQANNVIRVFNYRDSIACYTVYLLSIYLKITIYQM